MCSEEIEAMGKKEGEEQSNMRETAERSGKEKVGEVIEVGREIREEKAFKSTNFLQIFKNTDTI